MPTRICPTVDFAAKYKGKLKESENKEKYENFDIIIKQKMTSIIIGTFGKIS